MMESSKIREEFLAFFKSKGHEIVPSAPMVIKDDPTLMFTNAGMNQFKDIFLGNAPAKFPRVADTQKCLRVSGKHNDLEEVGVDTYHHTMFEMLGNWSFGDYFKKEAISWAWELLTEVYKIDKDRLYVTVFEGNEKEGIPFDQEAFDNWNQFVPEDRIINGSQKDNFWEMGDTGPCGPSSEIHIDIRDEEERKKLDGKKLVNESHPLVIEIWNLVFIEFNRMADGSLKKLKAQHVDTGMGFERLCMVLQDKKSNYDTDVFQPLINFLEKESDLKYAQKQETDIAMRVMSDHVRTISFAIADGQLPSNNGAGYVIRRILRRAVRYGYTFLDLKEPVLYKLVPVLVKQMGGIFPELKQQQALIERVMQEEESAFLRTLGKGILRFEEYLSAHKGTKELEGAFAFELYDTYGFPVDLTQLLARENKVSVDMDSFDKCMAEQKNRSRSAASVDTEDWVEVRPDVETEFIGYDHLETKAEIVKYRKIKAKNKAFFQVVLNKTPFYAESGGQVGDTGLLEVDGEKIPVKDTKKEHGVIMHITDKLPSDVQKELLVKVNDKKRLQTANNHSATHLLHAALRQILGTHVEQKGSLVNDEYLRFDFSHFAQLKHEDIAKIEQVVNDRIRQNIPLDVKLLPIEDAKQLGAMALFGEKYGDVVRVITFDNEYSIELCGGTHVPATGQIGLFVITLETAVAAGVRRIEARTGEKAIEYIQEQYIKPVEKLKFLLKKSSKDLLASVEGHIDENQKLRKKIEELYRDKSKMIKADLLSKVQEVNGVNLLVEQIELDSADAIKNITFELKGQVENLFLVLGAAVNGKPSLSVYISENLVKEKGLNASEIVRTLAREIKGGGGGQPFYATAGGSNLAGLKSALDKARDFVEKNVAV